MPWSPLRTCAIAGCTSRQDAVRCARHERTSTRNHDGRSAASRGYDAAYRHARAEFLGQPCAMRLAGCTGIATTAQHTDAGSLIPACGHCNYADGARRSAMARTRAPQAAGVAR